ncbi:MAG: homocysteine S-methyltransferase, partial [Gemmatimonadaceae bacterium]
MNPIAAILAQHSVVVLDGALATELERHGCDLRDPLWSAKILMEAPEIIRRVHADYFDAGADCATTASYQATFTGFARLGLTSEEAAALMQRSVTIAIETRDAFWSAIPHDGRRERPFVAASVGPYGAFLSDGSEYSGDYGIDEEALMDFHRPRIAVLAASGADILACETIPSLTEARAIARVLTEFPSMPAWITFSARDGRHISFGDSIEECAAELSAYPQIAAVGVNCTPPRYITTLVSALRGATDCPIVVYPNSGERYDAITKSWSQEVRGGEFADWA